MGWQVKSFKLPSSIGNICTQQGPLTSGGAHYTFAKDNLGKEVRFDAGKHQNLLRDLRPLTVTFVQVPVAAQQQRPPVQATLVNPGSTAEVHAALVSAREDEELRFALEMSKHDK